MRGQLRAEVDEKARNNMVTIANYFGQFWRARRGGEGLSKVGFANDSINRSRRRPLVMHGVALCDAKDGACSGVGRLKPREIFLRIVDHLLV